MATALLESLSEEQEALMDAVHDEYVALTRGSMDMAAVKKWVASMYAMSDLSPPGEIEICKSPFAALRRAEELTGEKQTSTDYLGTVDSGWVAFYDYFSRIGVLGAEEVEDLLAFRAYLRCVWDSVLLDTHALLVEYPTTLERDGDGRLHCATGPCIEWADGSKDFAWHGVWVPERVITAPRSYTKDDLAAVTSTEVRRAIGEAAGWDFVVNLLGVTTIDRWTDPKTGLSYELLGSDTEKWLRKESPKLQNGSNPSYVEPVHEDLKTAQAARKWQATSLSVRECEREPELSYGQES